MLAAAAALGLFACQKPDPASVHRDKGDELFDKDNWIAATEEYAQSLQIDPKQEKLWEKKAVAHMKAGKLDDAAASLLKLLDSAPGPKERSEVYRKVAAIYLEKKPDESEKYFLEAVKADPKDTDSLAWLGEIASVRGGARAGQSTAVPAQLEKAVAYYEQAIAINPSAPIPYVNKRIALFRYMAYEQQQKAAVEQEIRGGRGTRARIEEAKAEVTRHEVRAAELKLQIDQLGTKITELTKTKSK